MAGTWQWDAIAKAYRSPSGRKLTPHATANLRNRFAAARSEIARMLANDFTSGVLTKAQFSTAFEVFIGDTMTASFLAGRGGVNAMVDADMKSILDLITDQLGFADEFVKEMDGLSAEQIANQASLYGDAAVKGFEEGHGASHGADLPGYPGDWSTPCASGCRCYWEIVTDNKGTTYNWITASDDRVCSGCEQRGRDWNPWTPSE